MNRFILTIILLILSIAHLSAGSNKFRSIYSFGGTPVFAYDPDLGLRYGAVLNVFDYGQDSSKLTYLHYLNILAFNSTKGTSNLSVILESNGLISGSGIFLEASVINDTRLDFFGFNGAASIIYPQYSDRHSKAFKNSYYHAHQRKLIRLRADWHKPLWNRQWKLLLGVGWFDYQIDEINAAGRSMPADSDPSKSESLYRKYVNWGVIPEGEKDGNRHVRMIAGVAFDTRNSKINCTSGWWLENYLLGFSGADGESVFAKHILTIRNYRKLPKNFVFFWRLSSQQTIFGNLPFYMMPTYFDTRKNQDGFGGAFTLRVFIETG